MVDYLPVTSQHWVFYSSHNAPKASELPHISPPIKDSTRVFVSLYSFYYKLFFFPKKDLLQGVYSQHAENRMKHNTRGSNERRGSDGPLFTINAGEKKKVSDEALGKWEPVKRLWCRHRTATFTPTQPKNRLNQGKDAHVSINTLSLGFFCLFVFFFVLYFFEVFICRRRFFVARLKKLHLHVHKTVQKNRASQAGFIPI